MEFWIPVTWHRQGLYMHEELLRIAAEYAACPSASPSHAGTPQSATFVPTARGS